MAVDGGQVDGDRREHRCVILCILASASAL
jgi:hypothetical protein